MLQLYAAINETGSQHTRRHAPCQDHFLVRHTNRRTLYTLADGHGSAPYTRSGLGARMMCAAAAKILLAEHAELRNDAELAADLKDTYDRLVHRHLAHRPLADWELERLSDRPPSQAYGCTFLAALVTEQEVLCCQVGDGEIALVDPCAGFLPPLPADSACTANLTSSMAYSREDCLAHFRFQRYQQPVSALLLCSDGYSHQGNHPYNALSLLKLNEPATLDQVLDHGRHGDDLTFLLAVDPSLIATEGFQSCLPHTIHRGELLQQAHTLKAQLSTAECYLKLALNQIHAAANPEHAAALTERLRPRAMAYQTALQTYRQLQQELSC